MEMFEEFGTREVLQGCLYAIELDKDDNEIDIPVLYMDTLKVSTVDESISSAYSSGGSCNPKLMAWDFGRDIVVNLEDALFTPASNSLFWTGKLGAGYLKLYLRYFYDRNVDNFAPDQCLRTGTLVAEKFSDFMIIPDRWGVDDKQYVGESSIYCWMVDGYVESTDGNNRIAINDLILFYREQTQKWYFFNGKGPTENEESWYKTPYIHDQETYNTYDNEYFAIHYQYGREVFEWIREHITNAKKEYEPVAIATLKEWGKDVTDSDVMFLTQNLYIDGYRKGCDRNKLYSQRTTDENYAINNGDYLPYRYFANVNVVYNTNITSPQETIYKLETGYDDAFYIEECEEYVAKQDFCIDTDINMLHGQYRYLDKYSQTPLKVYLNPKTMQPYIPNAFEFYRRNGQRVTGNLAIIKGGERYYKWERFKAKEHKSLGKRLIIDSKHYPGYFKFVGQTFMRDRLGEDIKYQIEIPLCKLSVTNKLNLNASGDPTVFSMKLNALRPKNGRMIILTAYDVVNNACPCGKNVESVVEETSPHPVLHPEEYTGTVEPDLELNVYAQDRDIAPILLNEEQGEVKTIEDYNIAPENVNAIIEGILNMYSIDETKLPSQTLEPRILTPEEYSATIKGSESE